VLLHFTGLLAGALVSACLVYLVGWSWRPGAAVVGVVALFLGLMRVFWPGNVAIGGFKVPRDWEAWGPRRFLAAFGLLLGMGVVTTMPSATMLALVVWMWYLHTLSLIVLTFVAFAMGRLLTTATLSMQRRSSKDVEAMADALMKGIAHLPRVEAVVALVLGLTVLVAGI